MDSQSSNKMDPSEFARAMERLLVTVQKLSLARDLETIAAIVRKEARELTGADCATFVLRDGNLSYYYDEDAIQPLWKGKRFPMEGCISGWVMMNRQEVMINDIYADPRIPVDVYRPTFVKSLVLVPIRKENPIGAIGNYWSKKYSPSLEEVKLLQALADSASIAMENIKLYQDLKTNLQDKTILSDKLRESLSEKESLLKEIYHRVKNNLQVISSLLNLQANNAEPAIQKVLLESTARVQTMALVHEMLYQSENLEKISMKKYAQHLFSHLYEIYDVDPEKIQLIDDVENFSLTIENAIPIGFIINEIISNSFKHAFPDKQGGEIHFSLKNADNHIVLIISDNGVGISPSINIKNATSLGLRLIKNLTNQLKGNIKINCTHGTQFILKFSEKMR
ncbi:MAG: histidine kinase dimerization/phosphoacceptor domain -containing protein [Gammaproteobacteria bacterium]